MPYDVNRNVNRPLEFKGLTGQYIMILAAGILMLFILFFIFKLADVNAFVTFGVIGALFAAFLVWLARFSKKYGEHGFDKHLAAKQCPRFILYRKTLKRLLKKQPRQQR